MVYSYMSMFVYMYIYIYMCVHTYVCLGDLSLLSTTKAIVFVGSLHFLCVYIYIYVCIRLANDSLDGFSRQW